MPFQKQKKSLHGLFQPILKPKKVIYTFTSPPNEKGCTVISGEVKNASPYLLVYTWVVSDTKIETTVKWELESTKEGTKLTLEHSGISNYAGETAIAMFESFNGGWDNCISGLTSYLKEEVNAR